MSGEAEVRSDWSVAEAAEICALALPDLIFRVQTVHRRRHAPERVETGQLISIKTGGCPEGQARLRLSLTAKISNETLGKLCTALDRWRAHSQGRAVAAGA